MLPFFNITLLMLHYRNVLLFDIGLLDIAPFNVIALLYFAALFALFLISLLTSHYFNVSPFCVALFDVTLFYVVLFTAAISNVTL